MLGFLDGGVGSIWRPHRVQSLGFFEVNFDGLGARAARDYDLLWHIASFLFLLFLFLSIPPFRDA